MKTSQVEVIGEIALIALTGGAQAIIDADLADVVTRHRWHLSRHGMNWYATARVKDDGDRQPRIRLHRLVVECPEGLVVDHINGFGLDNRRCNLRVATHQQNLCNRGPTCRNQVGLKGVDIRRGRYRAQIKVFGRKKHLGMFDTAEEAHAAYQAAARELHGEFARMRGQA